MKNSIYGLTIEQLTEWLLEQGQKNSVLHKFGTGYIKSVSQTLQT